MMENVKKQGLSPRLIDLSRNLHNGSEAYPGDVIGVAVEQTAHAATDGYTLSHFTHLECHCGTHIDSPLHFIADGGDVTTIPLQAFPAIVVAVPQSPIAAEAFTKVGPLQDRAILVHTGWDSHIGKDDYYRQSPFITPAAARFLVKSKIVLLGLDFPSPDPFNSSDYPVHRIVLKANIPIVEGLVHLDQIPLAKKNVYFLALPLKIAGIEASPVRAVALLG